MTTQGRALTRTAIELVVSGILGLLLTALLVWRVERRSGRRTKGRRDVVDE